MDVSIIGTVGVPANYGGFETLVENIIGENASTDIKYTVFCSSKSYSKQQSAYKRARLKYIPLEANGLQSILYDILSLVRATRESDVIVVLGVSGCCFLPVYRLFSKKRLVINIDGLEHRRDKWGKWTRRFLKFSERMAVKYADVIVSDNKGIQDYVREEYGKDSALIAYGGDHVLKNVSADKQSEILKDLGLTGNEFAFTVCRIEPENNCHIVLEAFRKTGKKLAFVGNWERSEYGRSLKMKYGNECNIKLFNPIYDLDVLYALRNNCQLYVHGHSAGGTNPSLVEAMHFGRCILAFDVIYNRETTENRAYYFDTVENLMDLLMKKDEWNVCGENMKEIAQRRYLWNIIAKQYESLYECK